jgi:ABC-2 type transport system ATP-binding protein
MITVNKLVKIYSGKYAVNIESLRIEEGEIIGLVGNNGAGKTTFFRLLLDLIKANGGEIVVKEKNIAESEDWKNFTAAYLDEGFLIGYLTPEEYFYFVGQLAGRSKSNVDDFLGGFELFFDGSIRKSGKYIRDLSKGNQFKVGIAAALLQDPEILILDEPFANLDPTTQMRLIKMLRQLHEQRRITIFISSHDLSHVTELSSRILLMEGGRIVRDLRTGQDTLQELEEYFKV